MKPTTWASFLAGAGAAAMVGTVHPVAGVAAGLVGMLGCAAILLAAEARR